MVVGVFPAAKLASLFLKQVSKPIANAAKERAKHHPFFRTYICMPPAQFYNWCEIKAKMWLLNLGKPVKVPELSEAMAIELGANLLGEGIIFAVAAGLLIAEYARQVRKESVKEAARLQELSNIHSNIHAILSRVDNQERQLHDLSISIKNLESTKIPFWNKPKPPPEAAPKHVDEPSSSSNKD